MVKHYNPSIVQNAQRILNTKADNLSDEVSGPVAVIPIKPICRIVRFAVRSTSGSGTVYATPTDKDFYLIGCSLSVQRDAACDAPSSDGARVGIVIDSVTQGLIPISCATLTAFSAEQNITFPFPIKIDRGTNITITGMTFTVGTCVRSVSIIGYTEETTST